MRNHQNTFGPRLQKFIKYILKNNLKDNIVYEKNILSFNNSDKLIEIYNKVTNSNISYSALTRNFNYHGIKNIKKEKTFSYLFPNNFKLDEPFYRKNYIKLKLVFNKDPQDSSVKHNKKDSSFKHNKKDSSVKHNKKDSSVKHNKKDSSLKPDKIEFIKSLPINVFHLLRKNGCINYTGFVKTVKLTSEEEIAINNTEMLFNLNENGFIL